DYLTAIEKEELLNGFNNTKADYPQDKTIIDLFEQQVLQAPDNVALVFGETILTYRELNEKSNQLARYLRERYQIQADDLVGIKLDRSELMIVSILGILKSGGAYLPIDMNYPAERIAYIEQDSNSKAVLDQQELRKFDVVKDNYSKENPEKVNQANDLVYVIYTSGTTGNPKGVMIEHRNLTSFFINLYLNFKLEEIQSIACSTNITFDISVLEILGSLCHGKELILFSDDELKDPVKFMKQVHNSNIQGLQTTPSRLSQLYQLDIKFPQSLKVLLVGGESLTNSLYKQLKAETFESVNVYGPTETTIWSSVLDIKKSHGLSIGSPLYNEQFYILDNNGNLLPKGVTGEIFIGGDGLARGYLNNKKLTIDRFITNPFEANTKLYKTGDYGKWLSDGTILYEGRRDDQVKIRGKRIELGEIYNALIGQNNIKDAIVIVEEDAVTGSVIVAYVLLNQEFDVTELSSKLKKTLPGYMIPSHFVILDKFPLNKSGKTDKKALPNYTYNSIQNETLYVAPNNEIEERLIEIWKKHLKQEKIGIKHNFFEIGGNSLNAIGLITKIKSEFNIELDIINLFRDVNIEELAEEISNQIWQKENSSNSVEIDSTII
ncbi:amino acid adenylation domain-containing protein, partial [Flavobacterium sp. FlaQc-51]|uniref:non-ribosomal peptide synthetase n=1 Tax=Flavobacterium sp. FlaQc-51 TaxID=3374184 RepID=UPI003756B330